MSTIKDSLELLEKMRIPFGAQNFIHNSQEGNITAIELMLKAGMNVNTMYNGHCALHYASSKGRDEIVNLLIANGAEIDKKTDTGNTSLSYSIFYKQNSTAKILITFGANVNLKNAENKLPIELAKEKHLDEIVELLKSTGAIEPKQLSFVEKIKKIFGM